MFTCGIILYLLSFFQSRVLQCSWKLLPVLACRTTPIDAVLFKVLEQPEAGEIVVEEDVVVLVFQVLRQLLHHMCSKADFTIFLPSSVDVKSTEVAIGAVSQYPHFDSALDRLLWHVLLQRGTSLEFNHGLIHSDILRWLIERLKLGAQMVYQRAHFPKPIMCGVSSLNKMVIVNKVEVPGDLTEMPLRDPVCNRSIVKERVFAPVIIHRW